MVNEEVTVLAVRFHPGQASCAGVERAGQVKQTYNWKLQTVLRPVEAKGFVVLPKRWIVERTFAWLARYRRHRKDYEKTVASSAAISQIAMISLMTRRLAKMDEI